MTQKLTEKLLEWYQQNGRDLPWRVKGRAHPNPYVVLVSEFMLQQTTVKTVIPYFYRFMERFPTLESLAQASQDDVYQYWQGLGYYSRARSLQAAAQMIVTEYGGVFPQDKSDIQKLKGVGDYTSASIRVFAFNQPENVVDGNVIRVMCRLYHLTEPVDDIMGKIKEKASVLVSSQAPADYISGLMDLGALVCTPKNPQCLLCPWQEFCLSKGLDNLETIPQRKKLVKKNKVGRVFIWRNEKGQVFIRKREEKGLLHGLYEFPWQDDENGKFDNLTMSEQKVVHVFSHFRLELKIFYGSCEDMPTLGVWVSFKEIVNYPMSNLMKKVVTVVEKDVLK